MSFGHDFISKKDNFFPPKLDTFQKHVGCRKAIVGTLMLLLMSGLTTNMHIITRIRGFPQKKFHCQDAFGFNEKQSGSKEPSFVW